MDAAKIIVETFEKERPDFVFAIKLAVESGEPRNKFDDFLKRSIPNYQTSITYSLSLTCFDYYKKQK